MTAQAALGARIRELRLSKGLSQEELGFLCDTYTSHISRIERGDNNTSLEILARISAGLGVTLKDLLDFECELPLPVDDASTLAVLAHMRAFTPVMRSACRKTPYGSVGIQWFSRPDGSRPPRQTAIRKHIFLRSAAP